MFKIYKVPTTATIVKFNFPLENYLIHFENQIRQNVGVLDYVTNVKGQMTDYRHFLNDNKFREFIKIYADRLAKITIENNDPLDLRIFNSIEVVDAWGNRLKAGEEVKPHNHISNVGYSSVLYFSETFLVAENEKIDVKRGDVLTFLCSTTHWTEKATEERLSLPFNWRNSSKQKVAIK